MKTLIVALFLCAAFACERVNSNGHAVPPANEKATTVNAAPTATTTPAASPSQTSPSGECADASGLCLNVVEDAEREAKNINIVDGGKTKSVIKLPSPQDYNGYALNWAKKTADGFEVSIEYGSRNYFNKSFEFVKKDDTFYLTEIKVKTFDKQNPEKIEKKTVKVEPTVAVDKFNIEDYMND